MHACQVITICSIPLTFQVGSVTVSLYNICYGLFTRLSKLEEGEHK